MQKRSLPWYRYQNGSFQHFFKTIINRFGVWPCFEQIKIGIQYLIEVDRYQTRVAGSLRRTTEFWETMRSKPWGMTWCRWQVLQLAASASQWPRSCRSSHETNAHIQKLRGWFIKLPLPGLVNVDKKTMEHHHFQWEIHYFDWVIFNSNVTNYHKVSHQSWWLTYPSEKWWSESQLGWLFPIYGKAKKMFQTTNQYLINYH